MVYRVLWTLNFSKGVSGHQLFLVTLNFLEFFHLQSTLDSELFRGDVQAPTLFGHAKLEVKNFSEFFSLQSTVDSELFRAGGFGYQLFLVILNLTSKFFSNFLITEYCGLCISQR